MIVRNEKRKQAIKRYTAIAHRVGLPFDKYIDLLDSSVVYINMHAQKLEKQYERKRIRD